jgi:hypothetical protein
MNEGSILCSIQRALLGHVTPNLRAVYVILDDDIKTLVFYYDKSLSEDEEELASLADTEFISDCRADDATDCKVIVLPYPEETPKDGLCAYLRYEPPFNDDRNE